MSRITENEELKALKAATEANTKDIAEMKGTMAEILAILKQGKGNEGKKEDEASNAPKGTPKLEDYKPTKWGKRKGKGYTALRKAYAYACCEAAGFDYDKETYEDASLRFEEKYKESLKK